MTLPPPASPGHVVMFAPIPSGERIVRHIGPWRILSFTEHPQNGCGVCFVSQETPDLLSHLEGDV